MKLNHPSKLRDLPLADLLEIWSQSEKMQMSLELADVRGWLMDELENRDPEAFDAWIENITANDDPKTYFLKGQTK